MLKKSWFWAVLFAALFVLGGGAYILLRGTGHPGRTACIYVDGELARRIDLGAVALPYDFVVETKWGYNTVHVERGGVRVSEADCPDQICVLQGKITGDDLLPIVCLPHRLVIEIEGTRG